jgi:glycine betaine/proline transport system substrate-binding protein
MVETGRKSRQHALCVSLLLAALMATALLTGACGLIGGGQKPVIKLYDGQWDSLWVNNAIAGFIIEEGYGYPVETVVQTSLVMEDAIQKGEIDLNMEAWQQNKVDWYNEQIEKGNIVNLGMTYEAGPQFFIIPRWVAEQYSIKTIFDMQAHWELFRDPADPSKGVFYNCIIGWECAEVNLIKLEAYGLTRYYNLVSPGSSAALEAALAMAQMNREPVFGYYWAPSALMGAYDWHVLEEPPYTEQCWEKITAARQDQGLRPLDQACAYEALPIDKVAHKGLLKKAPDVVEMLSKMVVGVEPLNETLAWARENDVQDWRQVAVYYLRNYEDRWKTWVTPEAYARVKEALNALG